MSQQFKCHAFLSEEWSRTKKFRRLNMHPMDFFFYILGKNSSISCCVMCLLSFIESNLQSAASCGIFLAMFSLINSYAITYMASFPFNTIQQCEYYTDCALLLRYSPKAIGICALSACFVSWFFFSTDWVKAIIATTLWATMNDYVQDVTGQQKLDHKARGREPCLNTNMTTAHM